jgi:hypothetical protein
MTDQRNLCSMLNLRTSPLAFQPLLEEKKSLIKD